MIDLLTKQELNILTGKKHGRCMISWLAEYEWAFEIGADGYPRVDRRYYDKRMLLGYSDVEQQPNMKALEASIGPENKKRRVAQ